MRTVRQSHQFRARRLVPRARALRRLVDSARAGRGEESLEAVERGRPDKKRKIQLPQSHPLFTAVWSLGGRFSKRPHLAQLWQIKGKQVGVIKKETRGNPFLMWYAVGVLSCPPCRAGRTDGIRRDPPGWRLSHRSTVRRRDPPARTHDGDRHLACSRTIKDPLMSRPSRLRFAEVGPDVHRVPIRQTRIPLEAAPQTSAISNPRRHGPHRQDAPKHPDHRSGIESSWPASPSSWRSDQKLLAGGRALRQAAAAMSYTMDFVRSRFDPSTATRSTFMKTVRGSPAFRWSATPKSLLYIYGDARLDSARPCIRVGFNFTNPNAQPDLRFAGRFLRRSSARPDQRSCGPARGNLIA